MIGQGENKGISEIKYRLSDGLNPEKFGLYT